MDFLPQPKKVAYGQGFFTLSYQTVISLENTEPSLLFYANQLRDEIRQGTGLPLCIVRGGGQPSAIVLCVKETLAANTHCISVTPHGALLTAGSSEALCNGVQTLRQLVRRFGAAWPCVEIEDAPDFPNRGYYLDVSRGRVPTLQSLKKYADLLCLYKLNEFQLYVEHTYLFSGFEEAWRDDTPLTAEDILELDLYCKERYIELVPSLSTFGHMYKILNTKSFAQYRELETSEAVPFRYTYSGEHHTVNVSNDKSLAFIKGMISEYVQLFSSKKFNICADETFDLGKGRSAELAKEKGEQELYLGHVRALCEFLVENGRVPMFWGDIIRRFPQAVQLLPKETICLNWGYMPNQREDEMRILAQAGATQYACPGVCGWNQWVPLYKNAYGNITAMCGHAHKFSAIGILNTDWGDWGHINHPWLSVPAIIYGAAFSWNSTAVPQEEINAAVSFLEYGDESESLVSAMTELSGNEVLCWRDAVSWIENGKEKDAVESLDFSGAEAANMRVDAAVWRVHRAAVHMESQKRDIVNAICLAAESVKVWNDIGVYISVNRRSAKLTAKSGAELAARLERWYQSYLRLWRCASQESDLVHLTAIITAYGDFLRG